MEMYEAVEIFSSLSQETRLKVLKLLIEYGRDGAVAGTIAEALSVPANTLSFHLSHMSAAGLVTSKKSGRSVTYFANTDLIRILADFLHDGCCSRETKTRRKC